MFVGLDVSLTNTGVAVITGDGCAEYASFGYALSKGSELDRQDRICRIANQVMGFIKKFEPTVPTVIGIEDYAFSRSGRLTMLAELCGVLKNQCYIGLGRIPMPLAPGSVRKVLLGKDSRDKEQVREYLMQLGYPEVSNLDESDALAVAEVCRMWADKRLRQTEHGAALSEKMHLQMRRRKK